MEAVSHDPTPPLDEFLAAYDANDNEWWYLEGGDHLNLFDEALDRMRAAEAAVARCRALADELAHPDPDLIVAIERAHRRTVARELRAALDGAE